MKFIRPQLKPNKLEDFFSQPNWNQAKPERILKFAKAVLWYLNLGQIKVLNEQNFTVNVWVKEAILSYFKHSRTFPMGAGCFEYFDKLPVKSRPSLKGVRLVPGAIARFGSFIESGAILMPSFVNVGAYVGAGTMIDTWATVGSCAYIGKNVHLAGGVGIGGVLEPAQAMPVVIEDGAFIGSRCVVVEGVHVEKAAVLGAGLVLTASTKIVDMRGANPTISKGRIPAGAVVISGFYLDDLNKKAQHPVALIIGTRNANTDLKTSLNQALRDYNLAL